MAENNEMEAKRTIRIINEIKSWFCYFFFSGAVLRIELSSLLLPGRCSTSSAMPLGR
jgi:hypothetical protein